MRFALALAASLLLGCGGGSPSPAASTAPPGSFLHHPVGGPRRALLLLLAYPASGVPAILSAEAARALARDLDALLEREARGRLQLQVDVTPVLEMPQPIDFYRDQPTFPVRMLTDALEVARRRHGIDPEAFDWCLCLTEQLWTWPLLGVGISDRYAIQASGATMLAAHELGHAMRLHHANLWYAGPGSPPTSPSGREIDYGDRFAIMGEGHPSVSDREFRPAHEERLGWIEPGVDFAVVTAEGAHRLQPWEGRGIRALKIPRGPGQDYWIYYDTEPLVAATGPLLAWGFEIQSERWKLLDMTPGSLPEPDDWRDAALAPGRAFHDSAAGIHVAAVALEPGLSATVRVSFDSWFDPTPDRLPRIDLVSPADLGGIHRGVVPFRATAYDPDHGSADGDGIQSLRMTFVVHENEQPNVVGEFWPAGPGDVWSFDTRRIRDGRHFVVVEAVGVDGGRAEIQARVLVDNTGPSF